MIDLMSETANRRRWWSTFHYALVDVERIGKRLDPGANLEIGF